MSQKRPPQPVSIGSMDRLLISHELSVTDRVVPPSIRLSIRTYGKTAGIFIIAIGKEDSIEGMPSGITLSIGLGAKKQKIGPIVIPPLSRIDI